AVEDVRRPCIRLRVELLEKVISRKALVTCRTGIKATQSCAAEICDLLRGHLRKFLTIEVLPEILVVLSTVGGHSRGTEHAGSDDGKNKTSHVDLLLLSSSDGGPSHHAVLSLMRVSPAPTNKLVIESTMD